MLVIVNVDAIIKHILKIILKDHQIMLRVILD